MATQTLKPKDKYAQIYDFVCVYQHDKNVFTIEGSTSKTYSSLQEAVATLPEKTIYALVKPGHPYYESRSGVKGIFNIVKQTNNSYTVMDGNDTVTKGSNYATLDALRAVLEEGRVIRIFDSQEEYNEYYENEWSKDLAIQIKVSNPS